MSSIVHKMRGFFRLESPQRARFVAAAGSMTLVWALLRVLGYSRCQATLAKHSRQGDSPGEASLEEIELDAWAVRAAAERLPWASCLPQSLALKWLLARRGVETDLHFGVRKDEDDLAAHAWLEWDGRALTDPVDPRERYTKLEGGS